jgi:hypothetical protein
MFENELEDDLFKARPHKYVKRTGVPGAYKYWYKLPDGRIVEGDEAQQKAGRKEHVLRLLIARAHGKHSLTNKQIAERTGYINDVTPREGQSKSQKAIHNINGEINGMKKNAQRKGKDREEWHIHGHDFEGHHYERSHEETKDDDLEEGQDDTDMSDERNFPSTEEESEETEAEAAVEKHPRGEAPVAHEGFKKYEEMTRMEPIVLKEVELAGNGYAIGRHQRTYRVITPRGVVMPGVYDSREEASEYPGMSETTDSQGRTQEQRAADDIASQVTPASEAIQRDISEVEERRKAKELRKLTEKLSSQFGIDLSEEVSTSQSEPEPQPEPAPRRTRRPRRPRVSAEEQAIQRYEEQGMTRSDAQAAVEADNMRRDSLAQTSGPDAPLASEVHAADPILAQDDEPIRRMIEAQSRGENPYLNRAKEIFERTQANMEPKMRTSLAKFFTAMNSLSPDSSEATIKAEYDRGRARGESLTFSDLKSKIGSYRGVYVDMDEITSNEPLNPEIERAKRGYARKQFERMKPYIKDSWKQSNSDAPPPYPTWGDLKTWGEHGHNPEWSGRTNRGTAVPREVFDAAPKGSDGKPLYPPTWFPINLQPAWNFLIKSSRNPEADAQAIYANRTGDFGEKGKISGEGVQLAMDKDLQNHFLNAVRKYVQGRGGISQLVDIPSTKFGSSNLSHEEIFKADFKEHDLSDLALKKIMRHKIIDPIALAPFLKGELSANRPVRKSIHLVVDAKLGAVSFDDKKENLIKSDNAQEILKAEIIKKIKMKKQALKAFRIRG